ncbi:MAG: response regulator [Fibromonadales bacterium]|nr:response regulator [Fibromonadales bacterium]
MKTIFIVDDTDTNLVTAKEALEEDYRVFTMPSAAKMFAFLEKMTPDLILLDIEMPEMNGFTALDKLREKEKTAKIPVAFLTAHGGMAGATDFIVKPISKEDLQHRVVELLK